MADYTFHTLSDADFEELVCDLLRASLGVLFQSFAKGRDSGIDLLHGARIRGTTLVQCKHYCRSKLANLKTKLASEEMPKLARLKPKRFILATSLGLTPQNKEELLNLLAPFCHGVDDIYGQDDINCLLRQHPEIEASHYKLWLTSLPVLQHVLRHGTAVWNAITKDDVERKMSLYVQTAAYAVAERILQENHYCILSGIPGIGKTTLAQVLVTRLMEAGYELVAVRQDIQQAFDALDLTRNQVIYYDDFLGQSSIEEKLGKNEDKGIVRLLSEARRSKRLKVVFTTREYILEDAKRIYEPLNRGNLDIAKCIVKLEDYSRGHRARILYNHVYFSGLSHEFAAALIKDKSYRRIVDHMNYSPRIVEWMTIGAGPLGVQPDAYVSKFVKALDDPAEIWQHAFENQLADDARAILYCLGTVDGWLGLDELRGVWMHVRELAVNDRSSIAANSAFQRAMKQLDGSFVRTERAESEIAVHFHNPSIKDYIRRRIVSDSGVLRTLLRKALFFEQVTWLARLSATGRKGDAPIISVADDVMLHEAIERTIHATPATYRFDGVSMRGTRRFSRTQLNLGDRLATIARWATGNSAKALVLLGRRIGASIVASGDVERAATVEACPFLTMIHQAGPDDIEMQTIVLGFVESINAYMRQDTVASDWHLWFDFLRANESLFDRDDWKEWTRRAETFCNDEIKVIVRETRTSSQAESWYEEIESIAERWGLPFESSSRTFHEWLDVLKSREEDQDESVSELRDRSPDPAGGNDREIDRLFESLVDRAEESG